MSIESGSYTEPVPLKPPQAPEVKLEYGHKPHTAESEMVRLDEKTIGTLYATPGSVVDLNEAIGDASIYSGKLYKFDQLLVRGNDELGRTSYIQTDVYGYAMYLNPEADVHQGSNVDVRSYYHGTKITIGKDFTIGELSVNNVNAVLGIVEAEVPQESFSGLQQEGMLETFGSALQDWEQRHKTLDL